MTLLMFLRPSSRVEFSFRKAAITCTHSWYARTHSI